MVPASDRLRKALRAMRLARSILDYVPGDRWEQEVTTKDRDKFEALCVELLDKGGKKWQRSGTTKTQKKRQ